VDDTDDRDARKKPAWIMIFRSRCKNPTFYINDSASPKSHFSWIKSALTSVPEFSRQYFFKSKLECTAVLEIVVTTNCVGDRSAGDGHISGHSSGRSSRKLTVSGGALPDPFMFTPTIWQNVPVGNSRENQHSHTRWERCPARSRFRNCSKRLPLLLTVRSECAI
jgi:hypothetical protein